LSVPPRRAPEKLDLAAPPLLFAGEASPARSKSVAPAATATAARESLLFCMALLPECARSGRRASVLFSSRPQSSAEGWRPSPRREQPVSSSRTEREKALRRH